MTSMVSDDTTIQTHIEMQQQVKNKNHVENEQIITFFITQSHATNTWFLKKLYVFWFEVYSE